LPIVPTNARISLSIFAERAVGCGTEVSLRSPAWLLRQQLGREKQAHRAAAVVAAVDRWAFQVGPERFLLARACPAIDQLHVGPGPLLVGSPGLLDARLVIVLQPAAADAALQGKADHAGARIFVVALRMVDDLMPAAGLAVLMRHQGRHVLLEFGDQVLLR